MSCFYCKRGIERFGPLEMDSGVAFQILWCESNWMTSPRLAVKDGITGLTYREMYFLYFFVSL